MTIECVDSVLQSTYNSFQIYVVDNGSEKEDYQKLNAAYHNNLNVKLWRIEKNCGYVGGVNHGLKKAAEQRPAYFMIMNNDTIIDKNAIEFLVGAAQRYNDMAIVSGKVYYYDQPDILQHTGVIFTDHRYLKTDYPGRNEKDTGQFDNEVERDSLDDVFWLLPRPLVEDVGFYSNYFFLYAEQGDYAQRARRKGYKLIFTPDAIIWHKESLTTGGGNTKALPVCYWRGQGRFVFAFRNLEKRYFAILTIRNMMKLIYIALLSRSLKGQCAFATLRGYFWGLRWLFRRKSNDGKNPYLKQ
ncbi:MAG: glycosyltransferase [Bacteroidota bacterium]